MAKIVSLRNNEFKKVYEHKNSRANKYIVMYVMKNGKDYDRLGISVSKKIGNSVVRHRFCRLVRESFRLNEHRLKDGYDIVVVARPNSTGVKCQTIEQAFIRLCHAHNLTVDGD